jgi:glyoxylate reductase
MRVIYYDVVRNEHTETATGAEFFPSVDEVLKLSDIVSIHVPLLETTRHLMNAERFKLMKKTAFLVNTSRGAVVDEAALVRALKDKIIAGAGLDVYENEPHLAPGLAELHNVVLTPHIASATKESREEMAHLAAESVIDALEGGKPKNLVYN